MTREQAIDLPAAQDVAKWGKGEREAHRRAHSKRTTTASFTAGVYEQDGDADGGWRTVPQSRHHSRNRAKAAARRYARALNMATGGSKSWSGWWAGPDGKVHEITRQEALL